MSFLTERNHNIPNNTQKAQGNWKPRTHTHTRNKKPGLGQCFYDVFPLNSINIPVKTTRVLFYFLCGTSRVNEFPLG